MTPYQYCSNSPIANIELDGLEGIGANYVMSSTLMGAYKADPKGYKQAVNTGLAVAGIVFPAARLGQLGLLAAGGYSSSLATGEVLFIQMPTIIASTDKLINGENSTYEGGSLPTIMMNQGGPGMKKTASIVDALISLTTIGIPTSETGIVNTAYDVGDAINDTKNMVEELTNTDNNKENNTQQTNENNATSKKEEQPKTEDQKDKERSGMYIFPN